MQGSKRTGRTITRALLAAGAFALAASAPVRAELPDRVRFGASIEVGNVRAARQWLDEGLDPDFLADRIGSGLMIGAWEGNIPMMELFLERGARIDRTNDYGEQALQLAAWKGHLEAVRWLLDRGAPVNREGRHWSALHYATFAGHGDIVRLLLERGADVDARSTNGSTVLMMAAREGHQALAQTLLDAGADPQPVNDWGDTALTWAMRYGHLRIARLVATPTQFAEAVRAPPESFGPPEKSIPAPVAITELLQDLRVAEAAGQPTEALKKKFLDAVAAFKREAEPIRGGASAKAERPKALVITAKRKEAGAERAEIAYEPAKSPVPAKPLPTEVPDILRELEIAKAKNRPTEALRKALNEAVARFKNTQSAAPQPLAQPQQADEP